MSTRHAIRKARCRIIAAALLITSVTWFVGPPVGAQAENEALLKLITADSVKPVIMRLAADEFEGRGAGYAGEKKAAEFIAAEFKRLRLKPAGDKQHRSYFQKFKFHPHHPTVPWQTLHSQNVLAYIPGEGPELKQEIIVVGAHYDGQGRLGQADPFRFPPLDTSDQTDVIWNSANDNASGIAAVLAIASAIQNGKTKPKRSILFAAFGCEEHGQSGSIEYVTNPSFELVKHAAMINFDKLGRVPDRPLIAGATGSSTGWPEALKRVSTETGTQFKAPVPFVIPDSDHYAFAARGIPAVMLSVFGPDEAHRPTDTADKIDYGRVAEYARFGLALLLQLANQSERLVYADALGLNPGLMAHMVSDAEADKVGLKPPDTGLKVTGVIPGSAADRTGLKAGDFIWKAAGISFRRDMTLPMLQKIQMEIISGQKGMQLKMIIIRNGKQMDMTIDLTPGSR